uniref:Movement protein TGBp3 n=1 Tax=Potato virus H TaxID=1046402 RepID=A0A346CP45_9VIRU|nr:triple-gene-block protein 3 [Potato virus H]
MFELSRLTLYGLVIVAAFSLCSAVLHLLQSGTGCTVIITGESVKIIGCEFTDKFLEYARGLKPAKHW